MVLYSLLMTAGLMAQNRTVSGKVTDDKGKGLENVTITVKGTNIGTLTNLDGAFTLNVPANATTLVVSRVGFEQSEISISGRTNLTVQLSAANANLSEVVVVAYGQQQKRAVTGSISTVKAEDIQRQQITSAVQAIQGLVPGVLVINTIGEPGENPTVRIRGIGSYLASADPLIVVDGTPFNGNINTLNPNDIETINVLKDATATALYGSRAANGVLLITTKQGRKGQQPQINAYSSYGWVSRAVNEYPYVTAEQYMKLAWEAQYNTALTVPTITNPGTYATNNLITGTNGLQYNPYNVANPIDTNGNLKAGAQLLWETDWFKEMGGDKSIRKNLGIGVSGGGEKVRYYLSSDYLHQNGYIVNSGFKRITARLNTEANLRDWLTTGINMTVSSSNQDYPTQAGGSARNAVSFARGIASIYPLYMRDENGNLLLDANGNVQYDFGGSIQGRTVNHNRPVSKNFNTVAVHALDKTLYDRLQASMATFGEIKFTNYLRFRSNLGVDRYTISQLTYNNPLYGDAASVKGRVTRRRDLTTSWTWTNSLNFQKSFGDHNIGAMISSEAYDFKQENLTATRVNFPAPGIYEISAGATAESSTSSTNRHRIESYLGRLTYDFNSKYFLEGTFRRDGSTRFAPDTRWGSFYSVGASWVITGESFMRTINALNMLKLRASYGEVGNEAILNSTGTAQLYFPYISEFSTGWNDLSFSGVVLTSVTNSEITWEKLGTYNIGLDFAVLKNRLSGSVEYFNKNTFDLLFSRPLPTSSGFSSVNENIGKMKNYGLELELNSKNIQKKDFSWGTNFNIASLTNKITKLPQEKILDGQFQLEVGKSIRELFIYEWAGVDPTNGDPLWYKDEVVNGVPTGKKITTNTNSSATRYYFGSALPKLTGGLSNNFTYKFLDLSFLFNFAFGGKVLDADYIGLMHGMGSVGSQLHTDILRRWQKPGDITDVPKLSFKNNVYGSYSTEFMFSGDYIRLRNVTLGFTLPKSIIDRQNVAKNFRFYVQADNYWTWMRNAKKGLDPEIGLNGYANGSSSALKTFSVGLNVGF
jgi:TonB-linked SusC/RagA family outer membrane protein